MEMGRPGNPAGIVRTMDVRRHGEICRYLTRSGRRGIGVGMKYQPRLHVVLYQPEIPYNTGSVGCKCV